MNTFAHFLIFACTFPLALCRIDQKMELDDLLREASGGRLTRLSAQEYVDERSGSGADGMVFPAKYCDDEIVAVKWYKNREEVRSREHYHMFLLKGLPHIVNIVETKNIVKAGQESQQSYIAMDIAYNGSLQSFCDAVIVMERIPLPTRMMIARDVCTGLRAMHDLGIAHEDLKPDNVLLDYGLRAKLCDFGSSTPLDHPEFLKESGTEKYWSPEKREFIKGSKTTGYDRMKSDIYSLGCILEALALQSISQQLGLKDHDPFRRPEWPVIVDALGERSFNYKEDQLTGLTEAEIVNMAYCWTSLGEDCCDNLTKGRDFFSMSRFSEAFKAFQACLDLCDPEDNIITRLLMGTLLAYGLGTKANVKAACNLLMQEGELGLHKPHAVEEFTQFLMVAINVDKSEERLSGLARKGNPLAQNSLSSQWYFNAKADRWESSAPHQEHSTDMHSTEKHFVNNSLRFLFKAAKSGFALSQAALTMMYWQTNAPKVAAHNLAGGGLVLPAAERRFLRDASEAGSLLAHLLLGVVHNTLDKEALKNSERLDIFKFLAMVYKLVGDNDRAVEWLSIGAYQCGDAECLHGIGVCLSNYQLLEEALNQRNYRLSAFKCAILLQKEGREVDALSLAEQHLPLLLAKDGEKSRRHDESSQNVNISEALWLLLELEEKSEASKDAWYNLILGLQGSLSGLTLATIGEHYLKKEDIAKAIYWHTQAFEQGYTRSASTIGTLSADEVNRVEWWKRGEQKGCSICLHNLMIISKEPEQRVLYLRKGCMELKSDLFIYEYAMHLLEKVRSGEADEQSRKDAFGYLREAIQCGYEEGTFIMALQNKDNAGNMVYWMTRYLRNIHPNYAARLGARLHMEDPLELLLSSNKQDPLHPEAFWRLGSYYMLVQQQEKAFSWFLRGATQQEPKCSVLYGKLLLWRGDVKRAIPYFLHALWQRVDDQLCLNGIIQCLLCIPGQNSLVLILSLICAEMNLFPLQIQVKCPQPGGADEEGSSSGHEHTLFKVLIRRLPDFGAEEEVLLRWAYTTTATEKQEQEKVVRMYLNAQKKRTVASLYILSMFYARLPSSVELSIQWLSDALREDPQLSLLVDPSSPLTGHEFHELYDNDALNYLENACMVDHRGDDNNIIPTLARKFSMSSCRVSSQSVSKHPVLDKECIFLAHFELVISCSCIRGLLVSIHMKEQPTEVSTMFINININKESIMVGMFGQNGDTITILLPRRDFQALIPHDNFEDMVTFQVEVTAIDFQRIAQLERLCVDVVYLELEPSVQNYLQDLKVVWNQYTNVIGG